MTTKEFNNLDDSIESFELIKKLSEDKWKDIEYLSDEGKQVKGLKWKKGLTEPEINNFENQLGFKFPKVLKNFYSVMNGLAIKEQVVEKNEEEPFYQNLYRSYPNDIKLIKECADFSFNSFNISKEDILSSKAPMIFNYCGNRFLILDENKQVLSIRNDAIFFTENLAKGLAKDIFDNFYDTRVEDLEKYKFVKVWLENKYWC